MWWIELREQADRLKDLASYVHRNAQVDPAAVLKGPVCVEEGAKICHGAYIEGPVVIGKNCLIGNNAMIRGSTLIGSGTRIGFSVEVKNAIIGENVSIGPQCFVADSKVDGGAYLGAQVRTSNHRLDKQTVKVMVDGVLVDTGMDKLGCQIGARASLGIHTIVLPGRIVAPDSMFAPRITIANNLPAGRYRVRHVLESF
jgi:bifunctional UDP-N-acetylglucosamine pyrophosphorylase/glucosamine-1-phosphate N-acetyltransferase